MWKTLAAAVLFVACVPSARADEAKDLETLRACLAAAPDDERGCVGRIADPCQEEPNGASTPGIAACFGREDKAWDTVLNERYAAAVATAKATDAHLAGPDSAAGNAPTPVLETLRRAQRAWINYRDAECERVYALNQEGTIRGPAFAACRRDLTAQRVIELRAEDP